MTKVYLAVKTVCKCDSFGNITEEGKTEIIGAYGNSDVANDKLEEYYFDLCGKIDMHFTSTKDNCIELIDCDSDVCYLFKVLEFKVVK